MLRIKYFFTLLLTLGFGFYIIQAQDRRPSRLLVPEGYIGWVRIDYNLSGAPPLTFEDGHYLLKIPESGFLKTSTAFEGGFSAKDDYFYYSDDERTALDSWNDEVRMVWGGAPDHKKTGVIDGNGREMFPTTQYFVGNKEDYENRMYDKKDGNSYPRVGNVRINEKKN